VFHIKIIDEITNTDFVFSNLFFRKSCSLEDTLETFYRAGQFTDDNMLLAHCMLDT